MALVSFAVHGLGLVFLLLIFGPLLWAIWTAIRDLRGFLRVFWVLLIVGGYIFIPLIGLILAIGFLTFKSRFVDWQRVSTRRQIPHIRRNR